MGNVKSSKMFVQQKIKPRKNKIPIELICKIIEFSDNKIESFFNLSKLEKYFYENLKKQKHLMLTIKFKLPSINWLKGALAREAPSEK